MNSQHQDDLLGGVGSDGEDGESWLVSYLDVLTLLITLFVLLLAMSGNGTHDATAAADATQVQSAAGSAPAGTQASGLQPRHDGVLPRLDGVTVSRSAQGLNLRIQDHLLFDSGQATLTDSGRTVLKGVIPFLQRYPGLISVEGHSDSVPISTLRFPSNWELSSARASAVLRYVHDQGIPVQRLRAIGYADTRPLASDETADGRAANRRVELVLQENAALP
ncbi:flagellar motor protein MotS [Halomonas shantousis]